MNSLYSEYYIVVETSLALYNKECVEEVRKGNMQLSNLVNTRDGRLKIRKIFKLRAVLKNDAEDIAYLFVNLALNFAEVVQYNEVNGDKRFSNVTIDEICDIMTSRKSSKKSALHRYAVVNECLLSFKNTQWIHRDYIRYIKNVKEINWKNYSENDRQWLYQTCMEFGYFQTSSKPTDLFDPYFPVEFFTKQCKEVFGPKFNEQLLKDAIERTNILYRALDTNAGNIIFVNESVDPWHTVGLTKGAPDKPYEVIYIKDSAHSADIYPSSPEDSEQLIEARNKIRSFIKSWLSDDNIEAESSKRKLHSEDSFGLRLQEDDCVII